MKSLEIRTEDEVLKRALYCWWREYQKNAPEGNWVISDMDTVSSLGVDREITVSAKREADLIRPFSFSELEERIEGREGRGSSEERLTFFQEKVFLDGTELMLSPLEKKMLILLYQAKKPMSASELSEELWGEQRSSNQVNVYISYIRKKTNLPGKPGLIYTARGKGFYLKNE